MREQGLPKVLAWRWAPCAALVAGSLSFCAFALLVIPDHIGGASHGTESSSLGMGLSNTFGRPSTPVSNTTPDFSSESSASVNAAVPNNQVSRVIARGADAFPKRGFSPPLDRPEQPAPPPPQPQLQALPPPTPPTPPAPPPPPAPAAPTVAAIPPATPQPEAPPPQPDAPAEAPPSVVPAPVGAEAN